MYDTGNIFAKILRGEAPAKKLFENAHAVVIDNLYPKAKVHLLALPKGGYENFTEFAARATDEEKLAWVEAIAFATRGLEDDGYRLVVNTGRFGGQSVMHLHMHILGGEALRDEGL